MRVLLRRRDEGVARTRGQTPGERWQQASAGLIAIFCILILAAGPVLADADEDCNKGTNPEKVIEGCTLVLRKNPRNAVAYVNRASGYVYKGGAGKSSLERSDLDRAISDYTLAVEIDPKMAPAFNARGIVYQKLENLDRAFADFNRAIEIDPAFAFGYLNRGEVHRRKGALAAAIADYSTGIGLKPEPLITRLLLQSRAIALRASGEVARAIEDHDATLAIDKEDLDAYMARAQTREMIADWSGAIADYSVVIERDPKDADAFFSRGRAHMADGDSKAGMEDLNQAIVLDPNQSEYLVTRGKAHETQRDAIGALADFNEAIRIDPLVAALYVYRGNAYATRGNLEQALTDYGEALKLAPESAPIHLARAEIYRAQRSPDLSIIDYSEAIRLDPGFTAAYAGRGTMHAAKRDFDHALVDFGNAIRLEPANARHYLLRAVTHKIKGDHAQAITDLNEAVLLDPTDAYRYVLRAEAKLKAGQTDESLEDAGRALALDPDLAEAFAVRARINDAAGKTADAAADQTAENAALARRKVSDDDFPTKISDLAAEEQPKAEQPATKLASLKPGETFRDCPDCPEMVVIPAGEFTMGSPDSEEGRRSSEGPQRTVKIAKPFAVGKLEITRDQFAAFVTAAIYKTGDKCWTVEDNKEEERTGRSYLNPGYKQDGTHPVVCVSWHDAKAYIEWLSKKSGMNYRLLSESEWEYAARAVTKAKPQPRYSFGNNAKDLCGYANGADETAKASGPHEGRTYANCNDGFDNTAPSGTFKPNNFGLYDMHGNVMEWVEDCYEGNYKDAPTDGTARTAGDCSDRVLRSGSWLSYPQILSSAFRDGFSTGVRVDTVGFRIARTL